MTLLLGGGVSLETRLILELIGSDRAYSANLLSPVFDLLSTFFLPKLSSLFIWIFRPKSGI